MKRLLAAALCLLLIGVQGALAEDAAAGQYGAMAESAAMADGLEVRTVTSFQWGGLPLLDEATDKALGSTLKATELRQRRQAGEGGGYAAVDLILQGVSVLDVAMLARDGVYYEQSNLTGGQPVAFSAQEFQSFASRLSTRTQSVIPPDLGWLYAAVTNALSGMGAAQIDQATLDGATTALEMWREESLAPIERLRPKLYIPGLYGLRETVVDVTRDEALSLAQAYVDLLAENETLWGDVVRAQMTEEGAEGNEQMLTDTVRYIADTLHSLPELLEEALPEDLAASEYRTIYGPDDVVVAYQLAAFLPEEIEMLLEWVPGEVGVPSFYLTVDMDALSLELLVTQEQGVPETSRKITKKRDRTIAQMTFIEEAMQLDVVMTRTQDIETRADKESISTKTDWMMESAALFGEGAVITVTAETKDTASGAGDGYTRKVETVWRVKGLGFDKRQILKLSAKTTTAQAEEPVDLTAAAIRPGQMEDKALDAWIEETQVSMIQAGLTVLGRLPSDVASYILSITQE